MSAEAATYVLCFPEAERNPKTINEFEILDLIKEFVTCKGREDEDRSDCSSISNNRFSLN